MTPKREGLFPQPPSSIGRAQGAAVVRSSSFETLTTHPLLSPNSSTTSLNAPPTESQTVISSSSAVPRYVPYTPRQRVVTTSATTGTTLLPSVSVAPQQPQGGATTKLQFMNLKAAAQGLGLDTGSAGWAILEKLLGEGDASAELNDIWNVITKAKVYYYLFPHTINHHRCTSSIVLIVALYPRLLFFFLSKNYLPTKRSQLSSSRITLYFGTVPRPGTMLQ